MDDPNDYGKGDYGDSDDEAGNEADANDDDVPDDDERGDPDAADSDGRVILVQNCVKLKQRLPVLSFCSSFTTLIHQSHA